MVVVPASNQWQPNSYKERNSYIKKIEYFEQKKLEKMMANEEVLEVGYDWYATLLFYRNHVMKWSVFEGVIGGYTMQFRFYILISIC